MSLTLDKWINDYRGFVDGVLSTIIPTREKREPFLTQDAMNLWTQAMATRLFDPRFNYESLETLGDSALGLGLVEYLTKRYPNITPEQITNLKAKYVSKDTLRDISKRLYGFDNWVLLLPPIVKNGEFYYDNSINISEYVSILEDVFEAFLGAMFLIGDKFGYPLVKQFVEKTYDRYGIDMKEAKGPVKTRLQQMIEAFTKDKIRETYIKNKTDNTITLELPESLIQTLGAMGIRLKPVIAKSNGQTKGNAERAAYEQGFAYVASQGFTEDFVNNYKIESIKTKYPELQDRMLALDQRLKEDGFVTFEFDDPNITQTSTSIIIQLRGITPEGEIIVLGTVRVPSDQAGKQSGRVQLVDNYLRS